MNRINLFDEIEKLLLERIPGHLFPVAQYKGYSILSIINNYKGNTSAAQNFASLAEKSATQKTSGLRYHKYLGVVTEQDDLLDKLIK